MIKLGDLYAAIDDEAVYAQLPAMVAGYVGGRSGVTYRIDRGGVVADYQFSYFSAAMMQDMQSRFANGGDIWTDAGVRSGILNRATSVDELVPEAEFRSSALWNDFFQLYGDDTGHSLGLVHRFDDTLMVTSIHRAFAASAFTTTEAARLDAIGTDLHRIYRTRQMLGDADRRARRLGDMLDAHQETIFLVDGALRLVEASPAARRLLDARDGITLREGRLSIVDASAATGIRAAVAATVQRRPVARAAFMCARPSGKAPWRLLVLPASSAENLALLLLAPAERDSGRRWRWLRECFGLTRAEMEVAEGLIIGRTADEIAYQRQTSPATIRTHIRHLLEKTETRRITALISLLLSLP